MYGSFIRKILGGSKSDMVNDLSEGGPPASDDPNFKRIVVEIHFSRRFILSYHFCAAIIILGVCFFHWSRKAIRWRRRRNQRGSRTIEKYRDQDTTTASGMDPSIDRQSGSSSSSSTLGAADETSPLLSKDDGIERRGKGTYFDILRAWMIYQPKPIFFGKILPANGSSLIAAALLGLNVFYCLYRVPFSIPLLFVFADRTSIVFAANLPWLYVLAAKNQPLQKLAGLSYEGLNIYHRRLGEFMCLLAMLHGVGMFGVWYTLLRPLSFSLARFIFSRVILLGIGTLIAYELLYLTSLGSFRQRWYELFLASHIFLQMAALVLLWFHHSNSRIYVYISIGINAIDRIIYRMMIKTVHTQAKLQVLSDGETVRLSTEIPLRNPTFLGILFSNLKNGWKATDHIFISTTSLSWKDALTGHPFTIASSAPETTATTTPISFIIRAQSGFSLNLLHAAQRHQTISVRLDGPYGSHHALGLVHSTESAILIAGGSGIAVTWPLVWSLLSNAEVEQESFTSAAKQRILFIWIIHSPSHLSWIDADSLEKLRSRGVEVLISPPTAVHSRPDVRSWIREFAGRENLNTSENLKEPGTAKKSIGVVCSGPDSLNRVARNTCADLVREGRDVDVVVEKFGW